MFAPGHEGRKVEKALASVADFVILDWEDAVPSAKKALARETTLAHLASLDPIALQRVVIRVNQASTQHLKDDLEALDGMLLGAVMAPKVETTDEIVRLGRLGLSMVLLLETALGIEGAFDLARAHERVRFLAFGPLDLMADIGGEWTPQGEETLYARSRVPIAARAARCAGALDGPWPRLDDPEGLVEDTRRGRRLGYVGRLLIHPKQIDGVESAYAPSEEERAYALRVLEAAREAERDGRGAIAVDGRFVDPPVVRWARRVVSEAS